MAQPAKSVLWVDDEAELLEPHRIFLRDKGFDVETATNADDAVEMVRRRPFNLVLLDEQMPGTRGLEALRELREIAPNLPIVMVTKSEEDATMTEAIGAALEGYLVKPVTPRQVYAAVTRSSRGRASASRRSRARSSTAFAICRPSRCATSTGAAGSTATASWCSGTSTSPPRTRWGCTSRCGASIPIFAASSRCTCTRLSRTGSANLEGDRPPLSIDIVPEFLLPILKTDKQALFVVIDCLRLDQWRALEPIIAPMFDIETTHYFGVLPTATPYSRNALFSGLFPGEIAARFPDWWGEREDETLNAHERELLEAQFAELKRQFRCATKRSRRPPRATTSSAAWHASSHRRASARSSSTSWICSRTDARSRRSSTRWRATRSRCASSRCSGSSARRCSRCCRRRRAEGQGARHERPRLHPLQHAGDGVRQARRDAEPALQVRRGPARRESGAGAAVHE